MNLRLPSLFLLLGIVSTLLVVPATTFAQGAGNGQGGGQNQAPGLNRTTDTNFPVTAKGAVNGTPTDFTGNYQITKFQIADNGCLQAVGHLVLNAPGLPQAIDQDGVTMPVQKVNGKSVGCPPPDQTGQTDQTGADDLSMAQVGSCSILNLILGPLHLDVLGLKVDLNQVILNITAQPGAGQLLGNLLCAVAGLLDQNSSLTLVTDLLNVILGVLNGA